MQDLFTIANTRSFSSVWLKLRKVSESVLSRDQRRILLINTRHANPRIKKRFVPPRSLPFLRS